MSCDRMRLPCGADLTVLASQSFDGTTPAEADAEHQRSCPHCQAALRRIGAVVEDVRGLAAEPVTVPPNLLSSLMARLRSAPALVTVDVHARGATMVSEELVAAVARRAALSVAEVAYASVIATDANATGTVALRSRLVVAYGPPLHEVADRVRAAIAEEVAALTGATLRSIEVTVDDLA